MTKKFLGRYSCKDVDFSAEVVSFDDLNELNKKLVEKTDLCLEFLGLFLDSDLIEYAVYYDNHSYLRYAVKTGEC